MSVRTYGNPEKILAAKTIFYLFLTMILCLAFLFVVENLSGIAALYFRTKIGMLTLMTFYAMFRYKLAQRLKRSTGD